LYSYFTSTFLMIFGFLALGFDHSPCVNAGDSWVISRNREKLTKLRP
jgi:hypothetical protein